MSGPTPGPWVVYTPSDYEGQNQLPTLGVESVNGQAVVWYADRAECGIENDADARLIAAAPELLAALLMARERARGFMNDRGPDTDFLPEIDAAITKATGGQP